MNEKTDHYLGVALGLGLFATIPPLFNAGAQSSNKFRRANAKAIKGQYIVVLRNDSDPDAEATNLSRDFGAGRNGGFTFNKAIKGFSVRMNEAQAAKMAADSLVEFVEEDSEVSLEATQAPLPLAWIESISEICHSTALSFNATGSGVTVYIIDTGIRATHNEFGGRVTPVSPPLTTATEARM